MFTHEVDDAVERYTFGNVEVAFTYDMDAENPHYGTDDVFCGIERIGNEGATSDGCGWLGDYDTLMEALGDPEYYGYDNEDAVRAEIDEYAYFELRARNEYGWPGFRIAIHKATAIEVTGYNGDNWEQWAQGIVDTYAQWAEGRVYTVGVEDRATGAVEYMGGIYDELSESLARGCANDMGFEVAS